MFFPPLLNTILNNFAFLIKIDFGAHQHDHSTVPFLPFDLPNPIGLDILHEPRLTSKLSHLARS
jgi:hypothetical protein